MTDSIKLNGMFKYFSSVLFLLLFCEVRAQWNIQSVTQVTPIVLQYEKVEFDVEVTGAFSNPYDAADITLDMSITNPQGASLKLPCFFISGDAIGSQWKARFAPQQAGNYTFNFELRKNNNIEDTSPVTPFNVQATASDGFLHTHNNWTFQFDSGKPFRGIGENIGWEGRSWESDEYTYEYFLTKLANDGANYFRTWMSAWNLPLEWKKVVDTERYSNTTQIYHPQGSQRMDELVELCDSLGLYIMLAFDWHGALQTGDRWNINNYNTINGGPAANPTEFFTSVQARAQYKNRLRYIVARWGYATSIGAWEFFNEIDNAIYNGTESTIAIPHNAVTQWHDEMSTYLKSIDPYDHPVTTSVSHREITGLFNVTNLDFVQKHMYRSTGNIPSVIADVQLRYNKPFVVGEFGYDWDWNNINDAIGPELDFDFKRGLWYGLFSSTPVLPMSWWWEFFDTRGTSSYFKAVRKIYARMLIAGQGAFIPATVSATGLETRAVKCGPHYFIYVLNNSTVSATNKSITISLPASGNYKIESFDPETLQYTKLPNASASAGTLQISGLDFTGRSSKILIVIPEGDLTGVQLPYTSAQIIPGVIQAENFDKGGEAVAYHDLENLNTGNQYRLTEGVDIEACIEGGYNVTNTIQGEWIAYTVDIQKTGVYSIEARVAANDPDKSFILLLDGEACTDAFVVPDTDGSQNWQTITLTSTVLPKGTHTLKIAFLSSGVNLNSLNFILLNEGPLVTLESPGDRSEFEQPVTLTLSASASDTDGVVSKVEFYAGANKLHETTTQPYSFQWMPDVGEYDVYAVATDDGGVEIKSNVVHVNIIPSQLQLPYPDEDTPHAVPGKIEAENFDTGAENIAYHDLTNGNIKGQYRTNTGVDVETCSDSGGGYNVADIQAGEWIEYTINVSEAGKYDLSFRVATPMASQFFSVLMNDQVIANNVSVPNTGGWQTWQTVSVSNINLAAGVKVLKLLFGSEYFNLNYLVFEKKSLVTGIEDDDFIRSSVYPNPAGHQFSVSLSSTAKTIRIVNSQGQSVYRVVDVVARVFTPDIKLSAGMYTIIVTHQSGANELIKAIILK
jgi:hypothetical protein